MSSVNHFTLEEASAPKALFVFAHGAGADKDSDFMRQVASLLVEKNISVLRFNFPYMIKAAETGKKRPPDRAPALQQAFVEMLDAQKTPLPIFIGGKSMGGRMSTLILEQTDARGAMVFGYPFHPPGKPDKLRTEHLETMSKPVLILQGERDTFGKQDEVINYKLSEQVSTVFFVDGDHSLKPRKASGLTQEQHIQGAVEQCVSFINSHLA